VHFGRVASLAQPSQVLVSRTVTDLVAGSGLEFADRGEHDLKGVPGCCKTASSRSTRALRASAHGRVVALDVRGREVRQRWSYVASRNPGFF
jgi:hypothetical protein